MDDEAQRREVVRKSGNTCLRNTPQVVICLGNEAARDVTGIDSQHAVGGVDGKDSGGGAGSHAYDRLTVGGFRLHIEGCAAGDGCHGHDEVRNGNANGFD